MATILAPNGFYAVKAFLTIDFLETNVNANNTRIIYRVDGNLRSYAPGRPINAISGFEKNKGYYIVTKSLALDLTGVIDDDAELLNVNFVLQSDIYTSDTMDAPATNITLIAKRAAAQTGDLVFSNLKLANGTAAPTITIPSNQLDPAGDYDRVELRYNKEADSWSAVAVTKNAISPATTFAETGGAISWDLSNGNVNKVLNLTNDAVITPISLAGQKGLVVVTGAGKKVTILGNEYTVPSDGKNLLLGYIHFADMIKETFAKGITPTAAPTSGINIDFDSALNNLVNNSGVFTPNPADGGFNHTGLEGTSIPANKDGIIYFQYRSKTDGILGLNTSNAVPADFNTYPIAILVGGESNRPVKKIESSSPAPIEDAVANKYYGIERIGSTGNCYFVKSADGITFSRIAQSSFASTSTLYISCIVYGGGELAYPKMIIQP